MKPFILMIIKNDKQCVISDDMSDSYFSVADEYLYCTDNTVHLIDKKWNMKAIENDSYLSIIMDLKKIVII
ncbi:hypothetical protein PIROE2DRAFT_9501 [Piromyces sp. E2]|nr:hypothetical protein PIROE2DRAFT_9501 [Piromyces sp. E2]|eukprot:OUM63895.1 hypothetical protein PIROE2DRAFT_9501 [Piromyces sp. E2]